MQVHAQYFFNNDLLYFWGEGHNVLGWPGTNGTPPPPPQKKKIREKLSSDLIPYGCLCPFSHANVERDHLQSILKMDPNNVWCPDPRPIVCHGSFDLY